jgi:patatin-like phospholipase/acyl hydrolase
MTIRQLPPTKRPIILSLDGGGVRGLIQLGLLCALEKRIGLPIALLPDLCAGTSVGKYEPGGRISFYA